MRSLSDRFILVHSILQRSIFLLTAILVLIATLNAKTAYALPLPVLPDPALQACLDEQAAVNGWLNAEDVTTFSCIDRGVRDIFGIEAFTNLKELDLSDNQIGDVYPLNVHTGLSRLFLSGNGSIDFNLLFPIIDQNNDLTRLGLGNIVINGSIPVFMNQMTGQPYQLVELDVSHTGLKDLFGIEQYSTLQILDASANSIFDLAPLVFGPTGPLPLHDLDLSHNQIVDVNPLSRLNMLTGLDLSGNSGIDFNLLFPIIDQNNDLTRLGLGNIAINGSIPVFMNQMTGQPYQLVELDVSHTGLKDLFGIEQYSTLQVLDASNNKLIDISPFTLGLEPLPLHELNLSNNRIVDVNPLSAGGFIDLNQLDLSGNSGIDFNQVLAIIHNNTGLTQLGLGDISINGPLPIFMNPMTGQPYNLIELNVSNTGLVDLYGIDQYPNLQILEASNNQLEDITSLAFGSTGPLPLRELDLSHNQIVDVNPLSHFSGLTHLNLSGNSNIDFNVLWPIIDQNNSLTRLGLGDIAINGPLPVFMNQMTWQPYQLVELNVNSTGLKELLGIEQYGTLQILDAANNELVDIAPLAFGPVGPLPLRELNLSNNQIVDVHHLSSFTELTHLDLSGNSSIDFNLLFPVIDQNNGLTRLGLGDIAINGPLPIFMNQVTGQPYDLVELNVSNTGLKDLFGIEQYGSLRILDAANNQIADIAPLAFGPTGPLPLRELDLSHNQIVDVNPLSIFNDFVTLRLSGNSGINYDDLAFIIFRNGGLTRLGLGGIAINGPLPFFYDHTIGQLYNLVELDVSNTGVIDLYGIEQYVNLENLDASNNKLVDITSLAVGQTALLSLRELDLSHNKIVDVNPLNSFSRLTTLRLSGNRGIDFNLLLPIIDQNNDLTRLGLADIAINGSLPVFINQMTWQPYKLIELEMSNTGLKDLFGIEQYGTLQMLDVANNEIVDITPLAFGPTGPLPLRELDLSYNQIVDVNPLTNFTDLTSLDLSGNHSIDFNQLLPIIDQNNYITRLGLGDIAIHGSLPIFMNYITGQPYGLVELNVNNTDIKDLFGIELYSALQILDAANNQIIDISPLAFGPTGPLPLRELDLSHNQIVDVNPLSSFTGLTTLRVSGNRGIDFGYLFPIIDQNNGLTRLGLGGIAINGPLPPLLNQMTWQPYDLVELDVSNTGLVDVYGIEQYQSLQILDASNNGLFDISPLAFGPTGPLPLRELDLSHNQIVDVNPLSSFTSLTTLRVSGNRDIDFGYLFPIIDQNNDLTRLGLAGIAINGPLPVFMNQMTWQPYNLVELNVNNTGLMDMFGIEQYSTLQILDASNNHLIDISPLAFGSTGPLPLRELDLSHNQIVDVNPLTNFTALTSLDLSGNNGIDFNLLFPIIDQNNNLTRLGLGDIAINGAVPVFMNQMTWQPYDLVELNVSNTGIQDLFGIEQYGSLRILDAANNQIVDISPLAFGPTGPLPLLELNLSHNQIVDVNPLSSFSALTRLGLSGNSSIDFNQLVPIIDQNNDLIRLGLGDIKMEGQWVPVFINQYTGQPYNLIELDISNTGLQGLFGIEQYSQLQILDASNNALFDIAPLQYGVNGPLPLRELNLSNNQIVEVIPLSTLVTLESLDLTGNTAIPCDQLDYLVLSLGQDVVIRPASCVVGMPPTINIVYPYTGYSFVEGEMVQLSVDAFDPETGNVSHAVQWSSSISGQLGTGALVYVQLLPGDQVITATIVDSDNNSATSSVSITVLANNAPTLNIHSPYAGQTIIEGQVLNAFADAFDVEDGGLIHDVVWTSNIDGEIGTGANIPLILSVGSHVITATVTDMYGKSASQSVTVNVVFNNLPVVIVTSPITGSSTIEGEPLNLTVIATDVEDGTISDQVRWRSDLQGDLGMGTTVPVNLVVGVHNISATVTDLLGKTTTQNVTLTVEFNNPPTLTVTSPTSGSSIIEGDSINLAATSNDIEDGDLSSLISWSSNLQGYLGAGSVIPVDLLVGDHVVTASIVDAHGKMTSQTTAISVVFNNPPVITFAAESVNQSIEDGLSATLSASAIDIEDGDISTAIQWSSDIVGNLGTGNNLSVVLPVGNHQVTAIVNDLNGKLHSMTTQVTVNAAPVLAYCDSYGLLADRQWIQSVSIAGTVNVSGSQGGYGDYWNNGAIYLNRTSNQLTLEPGFHNNPDRVSWYVWIDLNRDGVFADDERILKNRTSSSVNTSFDVPATAITGNTRMRISMKRRRSDSACGDFGRGEVEDYRVILLP